MARRLVVEIVGDPSGFSAALGKASAAANGFGSRISRTGESISAVGKHMVVLGGIATAVTGELGKQFVEAGLQAQEQTGKLDVALRNAGQSADKLRPQIDAVEAANRRLGFTNADTRESLTTLVQSGEKVGAATKDMALAEDYARVKGESLATATTAIVKVHQGLLRPLKELGISLPAATDHMKALTAAHKKAKTAITATEKALAFQQDKAETGTRAIAMMTQKIHGQAKEFANSAAGGMASFSAQLANIKERMGTSLLPLVSRLTDFLSSLADKFSSLSPHMQKVIALTAAGAFAFSIAATAIGGAISVIGELITALGFLAANPLVLVIVGVAALAAAVAAAVLWPDKLRGVLEHLGLSAQQAGHVISDLQHVFAVVKQASTEVSAALRAHWPAIEAAVTHATAAIAAVVRSNWPQIKAIIVGVVDIVRTAITTAVAVIQGIWSRFHSQITTVARSEWSVIKATITNALTAIRGIIDIVSGLIHGDWSRVWQGIKELTRAILNQIEAVMRNAATQLGALASVAGRLVKDGILKPIGELLTAAAAKMSQLVGWFRQLPGKILAALGDLSSLLVNAGVDIVEGFIHGIESKMPDVVGTAKNLAHKVKSFFSFKWGSTPHDWAAANVGAPLAQGIADGLQGFVGLDTALRKQVKSATERARIAVDVVQAGRTLGMATAAAIADGIVGGTPTMEQQVRQALTQAIAQARQAVADARSSFASAFDSLAQSALQAFDNRMSKWTPPALKLLDKMQLQDQVNQAKQAITDAMDQLAAAQKTANDAAMALSTAETAGPNAGESQADYQARVAQLQSQYDDATKQVTASEKALGDAKRQQQELNLQLEAQTEQEAHDKRMARQRENLAKQLLALQTDLAKHPEEWRKSNEKVLAILKKYEVPMYEAGQKFASKFADGLRNGIAAVAKAAHDLADALDKYVPHSPARTGPLSKYDAFDAGHKFGSKFATGISTGLYTGRGLGTIAPRIARGASAGVGAALGTATARGGQTINIELSLPNYLGDRNEVVSWVRDELTRIGKRDGNIFGGYA